MFVALRASVSPTVRKDAHQRPQAHRADRSLGAWAPLKYLSTIGSGTSRRTPTLDWLQ